MSDVLADERRPIEASNPQLWEFTENGLIILPSISWGEWTQCWAAASGLHQRSKFYLGDCLNAGEEIFGEQYAQVVGDYSFDIIRSAMFVARRFPPARRRLTLSFTKHQVVAGLEAEDQDALLDEAECAEWNTAELRAAVKVRKAELRGERRPGFPSNGGPVGGAKIESDGDGGTRPLASQRRQALSPLATGGDETLVLMRERAEIRELLADWWRRWAEYRRASGFDGDLGTGLIQIDDWARDLSDPRDCSISLD